MSIGARITTEMRFFPASRNLDGSWMYPGMFELTWLCLDRAGVRILLGMSRA